MNIPYDLIAAMQPQDYRDNAAASQYAFEKVQDYKPTGSPYTPQGRASEYSRAVANEILRLKREYDGPRGSHAAL